MTDEDWQPPCVLLTVDLLILTLRDSGLEVLLVERGVEPFEGMMALPGGFLHDEAEPIAAAAHRELSEETGLDADALHLEEFGVYGDPGRDPRGRVVSVAYLAIMPQLPEPVAGTDAAGACWTRADDVLPIVSRVGACRRASRARRAVGAPLVAACPRTERTRFTASAGSKRAR